MKLTALLLLASMSHGWVAAADAIATVPLAWGVDRALLEGALSSPPLDLWRDPAAATAVAHVVEQMRQLSESPRSPPVSDLVANVARIEVRMVDPAAALPAGGVSTTSDHQLAMMLMAGKALAPFRTFIQGQLDNLEPATLAGFAAFSRHGFVYGFDETTSRCVVGGVESVPVALAAGLGVVGAAWPHPAWLRSDLRGDVTPFANYADVAGIANTLDHALPGWRTSTPCLEFDTDVSKTGITSSMACTGIALPLREIDAKLLARARSGNQVSLAFAVQPMACYDLLLALAGSPAQVLELETESLAAIGAKPHDLVDALAGDVLIQGAWTAGPVPQVVLMATLAKVHATDALVSTIATHLGGSPVTVAGTDAAWSFPTPAGAVSIARSGSLLIVSNDDARLEAALSVDAGAAVFDHGGTLLARVDAVALAKQWLPLAYSLAANAYVPLGEEPLMPLFEVMREVVNHGDDHERRSLSELMADKMKNPYYRNLFDRLFPGGDPGSVMDKALAMYAPKEAARRQATIAVMRTADGFVVVDNRSFGKPLKSIDAKALGERLAGFDRIAGPAPEELAVSELPPRPAFDRRWLPPMATVIAHLRPYRLDVTASGADSMLATEQGLPLLAPFAYIAANVLWDQTREIDVWREHILHAKMQAEVIARHQPLVDLVRRLAVSLQANWNQTVDHASDLLAMGDVPLADCAPLLDGKAPVDAAGIDRVGAWYAVAAGPYQVRWVIPLEARWVVYMDRYGNVQASDQNLMIPADAETAKPVTAPTTSDF